MDAYDADTNTNADTGTYSHANTRTNTHANARTNSNTHANSDTLTNSHAGSHSRSRTPAMVVAFTLAVAPMDMSDEFFLLANPPRARLIKVEDIVALWANRNHTEVHLDNDEKFLVTKGLREVQARLGRAFFRANRTCAVNLGAVKEARHVKRDLLLTMRDGEKVLVSRRQARVLKARTI